jgi:hypothetical protein
MTGALASLVLALQSSSAPPATADPDRDGDRDGLSDFQEQHKYFTDPRKADSDGDGIPDGDWDERREYAYSVRTIVQVLPPVTPDVLCDDYQDARILESRPDYVELEVVHYPLNTVADAIVGDPEWRKHVAARKELKPFLEPGLTANWNSKMRDELVAALGKDGIDVARLDDKQLVEQASKWLFQTTKFVDGFTTYCSTFDGKGDAKGKARVLPGSRRRPSAARTRRGSRSRSSGSGSSSRRHVEEQGARQLHVGAILRRRLPARARHPDAHRPLHAAGRRLRRARGRLAEDEAHPSGRPEDGAARHRAAREELGEPHLQRGLRRAAAGGGSTTRRSGRTSSTPTTSA